MMKQSLLLGLLALFSCATSAQIIINEIDVDNPGTDDKEFVELYDGGTGSTPLDGYVLVLFNGSDDASYAAYDLDGKVTDENGYFVIGSVDGADMIFSGSIQNGSDAIALYKGDDADFPNDTQISLDNLIDAVVYDTNDADDEGLLVFLNTGEEQVNEDMNGDKDSHSLQRSPDGSGGVRNTGTYVALTPTPGASNDLHTLIYNSECVDVDIYPNPFNSVLYIESGKSINYIIMYDVIGQLVSEVEVNSTSCSFNTGHYRQGMYFLNINFSDGSCLMKKLVKD